MANACTLHLLYFVCWITFEVVSTSTSSTLPPDQTSSTSIFAETSSVYSTHPGSETLIDEKTPDVWNVLSLSAIATTSAVSDTSTDAGTVKTQTLTDAGTLTTPTSTDTANMATQTSTDDTQSSTDAGTMNTEASTYHEQKTTKASTEVADVTTNESVDSFNFTSQITTDALTVTTLPSTDFSNVTALISTDADNVTNQVSTYAYTVTSQESADFSNVTTQGSTDASNVTNQVSTYAYTITSQASADFLNVTTQGSSDASVETTNITNDVANVTTQASTNVGAMITEGVSPTIPNIDLKSPVTLGMETIEVSCFPNNNGILFQDVNSIQLEKNSSSMPYSTIVTVYYDRTFGSVIQWLNTDVQSRANASGDISTPRNSRLVLTISGEKTECADEGAYRCRISGIDLLGITKDEVGETYLDIEANPEQVNVTAMTSEYGISDTIGVYPSGTVVNITCSGMVGDPPQKLHWCIQNGKNNPIIPFSSPNISLSESTLSAPCRFSSSSSLLYTVNDNDLDVTLICHVGTSSNCGSGIFNSNYTIIAGNPVEPKAEIQSVPSLILGLDSLEVACLPSDNGDGFRDITSILLSFNRHADIGFLYLPLVEVRFNESSGVSELFWYSASLEERTSAIGDVTTPSSSNLTLIINDTDLICEDEGRYRCEITGKSMKGETTRVENSTLVDVQALPEQTTISLSTSSGATSNAVGVFPLGTALNLTCFGNVGDPPQNITWCMQNGTHQPFLPYPFPDHISQSEATLAIPCQYNVSSTLMYTVEGYDVIFLCQVGSMSECGGGIFNDTYTVITGNAEEPKVNIEAASSVILGVDGLTVTCSPSGDSGQFREIYSILLSLNPFGDLGFTYLPKVEIRLNKTSSSNEIIWHSSNLQSRASVYGDVLLPESGNLTLVIDGNQLKCQDQGRYRCEITGRKLIGEDVLVQNSSLVDVQSLPSGVDPISVSSSDSNIFHGSVLNLTCNAAIGDPPNQIRWCIKNRTTDAADWIQVFDSINQSTPSLVSGCNFTQSSTLSYTITSDVEFLCEVGGGSCGFGVYNSTYLVLLYSETASTVLSTTVTTETTSATGVTSRSTSATGVTSTASSATGDTSRFTSSSVTSRSTSATGVTSRTTSATGVTSTATSAVGVTSRTMSVVDTTSGTTSAVDTTSRTTSAVGTTSRTTSAVGTTFRSTSAVGVTSRTMSAVDVTSTGSTAMTSSVHTTVTTSEIGVTPVGSVSTQDINSMYSTAKTQVPSSVTLLGVFVVVVFMLLKPLL